MATIEEARQAIIDAIKESAGNFEAPDDLKQLAEAWSLVNAKLPGSGRSSL